MPTDRERLARLVGAPHRFIPTSGGDTWWDLYYEFITCCRGPDGLAYYEVERFMAREDVEPFSYKGLELLLRTYGKEVPRLKVDASVPSFNKHGNLTGWQIGDLTCVSPLVWEKIQRDTRKEAAR